MCTLSYLVQELRTGDVAVIGSESYANLHDQLLSWEACQPLVAGYREQAGLPDTATAFTAALKQQLTVGHGRQYEHCATDARQPGVVRRLQVFPGTATRRSRSCWVCTGT